MQERSTVWKELAETGSFRLETAADIGGKPYTSISAPVINRAAFSDALSVGNCVSATLQFSMLTADTIPKSAEIIIRERLTDGVRYSEWLPAGTFYISKRTADPVTGLLTLQCYDAMLKANAPYTVTEESVKAFPKPMADCIREIAERIGVEVDSRTWACIETGFEYVVPVPVGLTMMKVLGYIAGVHGGNFVITQENKLRFIPLCSKTDEPDQVNIRGILGKINLGDSLTVSRITMNSGRQTFSAGDSGGFTIQVPTNPYATQAICDELSAKLGGLVYFPYTLERAVYDPAAEIGDRLVSRNDIQSVLYSEHACLNLAFRGDVSAPFKAELEDEYPHIGTSQQIEGIEDEIRELITIIADKASMNDLYAIRALIENLSVEDIRTGIIHSNDYEIKTIPYLYPASNVYPSSTLYPSNGETVLKGFAIDFASGVIYGAFYSEQIVALQKAIDEIVIPNYDSDIAEIRQDILDIWDTDQIQAQNILVLQNTVSEQADTILLLGEELANAKQTLEVLKNSIKDMKDGLLYPKSLIS